MLPSRAVVRSARLSGGRQHIYCVRNPPIALSHRSRLLSSSRCSALSSIRRGAGLRPRGPSLLGPGTGTAAAVAAASRQFSLWGYSPWGGDGKKNTDEAAAALSSSPSSSPSSTDPKAGSVQPVDPTPESVIPVTESDSAVQPDLSSITDIVTGQDVLNMPEHIGYLHALGLDFGWGPTSTVQWLLEHVHIYSGWGWGASILATAVLLRCVMIYPQIRALKFNTLMQKLRKDPRSEEAMKLVQQGWMDGDVEKRQKGQLINKMLKQQYGVSSWEMLWSFGQIPFTFGLFRIITGMANVPVPAMETAGYLWFTDLTATDPLFILPAAGTALMVAGLAVNMKYAPQQQKKMMKPMMYIFGGVGFFATTFLSAAVNLMAVAIGASTLATAVVLNNALVRRVVGLPPHTDTEPSSSKQVTYEAPRDPNKPQPALKDRLNTNLNDMKQGLTEQLASFTGSYSGTEQEKAEKKRRDLMRKLEQTRKQQEREEFDRKYKRRN